MRSDVGSMFAIGSIKEDFLGYTDLRFREFSYLLISLQDTLMFLLRVSIHRLRYNCVRPPKVRNEHMPTKKTVFSSRNCQKLTLSYLRLERRMGSPIPFDDIRKALLESLSY